jgi:hypothetical protein
LAAVAAASLLLLAWSFRRLAQEKIRAQEVNRSVQRLSQELDQLGSGLSMQNASQLLARLKAEEQEFVLPETGLTNWISSLKQRAQADGFDLESQLGQPVEPAENPGLAFFPVRLELVARWPTPEGIKPDAYQEILHLCQHLAGTAARIDVVQLELQGGGDARVQASVNLHLWVGKSAP